ncbi:MAG: insulinase family protein [Cellvibrionales bacterium]|nr:insulinase family protein [Porticoccaceae bacterium]|tara:strand:+ start:31401 stop:34325 length:2925 start_codon:yes stop_codon:yes gene_type:complete
MPHAAHPAFELVRVQDIDSLNLSFAEYRHLETGAQHIHLQADNKENVFMVALRTVPMDSTGVAHILEHTALCGSEKYPVRDPFFMMIRRSLNTFMNAFTSSDWTAYPFASQNVKDFNNLLEVYLDSVFFARLDPLDFAQEGHRLEFADADDSSSPLTFKGIVFNEMKGAMSSINSTLWQTLSKYLYPTNTYHFNSGGDPAHIPDLSYEQFLDFYRVHYHPSNAIFLTFGDIPAADHQARFQDLALQRFQRLDCHIAVADEQRYSEPQYFAEPYASDETESDDQKTHIVMAWLLGDSTDLEATMEARLLASVLLDNSGSPLMQALESTDLATSPSPMCGLEDSQKQLCFACGVEGSETVHADMIENMVLAVVQTVADKGLPLEQVAASLHQLELQQREISGGGYPYGLSLTLTALTSATHRGDPMGLLDLDPVLEKLHRQIQDPNFIKSLARRLLLDNPHRVRLVMAPDSELGKRREKVEKDRLINLQETLDDSEKLAIVERAQALKQRQEADENMDMLPRVGIADVPEHIAYAEKHPISSTRIPLTAYAAGTNGLVYQQVIIPFPAFDDAQLDLLPLYTACATQLGVGERDYQQTQLWQAGIVGNYSASASVRSDKADLELLRGNLCFSVKGLARNQLAMSELLQQSLEHVRFDELPRLRELVAQIRNHKEASIVGNGHVLAMTAAASGLSPSAHLNQRWSGLSALTWIKTLDQSIDDSQQLTALGAQLQAIHQLVLQQPRQFVLVAEEHRIDSFSEQMEGVFADRHNPVRTTMADSQIDYRPALDAKSQCWATNTQVSFCAKAYPTVASTHPDAAALTVLGGVLRNGFLHRKIREQGGAYGGGASQDNQSGAFRFFSYRDPRIEGTLQDFDASIQWLLEDPLEDDKIEEAVLGVIGNLDKPASPAGEAISAFHGELNGRDKISLTDFRRRILGVSREDLKRVAATYLRPEKAFGAVITNSDLGAQTGMEMRDV